MKAALVLLVLACSMAVMYGDLICGLNYCRDHPCTSPITERSCQRPAEFRSNHAGKCACCPACVTFLNENAACRTYSKELGETPSAICREPLRCVNQVCSKVGPIPRA